MSSFHLLSALLSAVLLFLSVRFSHSQSLQFSRQTDRAPFSGRSNGNVESLPRSVSYINANGQQASATNPLILQGSDNLPSENDVWISPNSGVSWFLLAGVAGAVRAPGGRADTSFTTPAAGLAFTTDPNGNIYRIQGQTNPAWPWDTGVCTSETWISSDGGQSWKVQGSATPLPARKFAAATSALNGDLYILGGHQCDWPILYDVWRSTNQGVTWGRQAAQIGVSGPAVGLLLSVPVAQDAKISYPGLNEALVYTTGWNGIVDYNEVYMSTTQGSTWLSYQHAAAFSPRDDANGEVTRDGLLIVVGGKHEYTVGGNVTQDYYNDVWVSPDGGWTWGLCVEDAGFTDRRYFMTVLDTEGYLYIIGGADANQTRLNDVWRSTISFHDLGAVERTCRITRPPCGYGLTCFPNDPTLSILPRGVSCAAAERCGGSGSLSTSVDFLPRTNRAPWSARSALFVGMLPQPTTYQNAQGQNQVSPPNSFIMHGNDNYRENDVWISTNKMATWSIIAGASIDGLGGGGGAPGGARSTSFSVPVPRGAAYSSSLTTNRMYRISGETVTDQTCTNQVWTTTNGVQWTVINTNSWNPRIWAQSVVSADGSVYLFGGRGCVAGNAGTQFDVWRSADFGNTWNRQSTNFPANGPRNGMSGIAQSRILGREIITYASGWGGDDDYNDVVVSSDQGVTWSVVTQGATWSRRDDMAGVVTPDGVIVMIGGKSNRPNLPEEFHNDIWVSMDGGYSFGRCNEDVAFTDRRYMTAALDENGYLYIVGGQTNQRGPTGAYLNDAWRSTLSFTNNLTSISSSCNVTIPRCGTGLSCWPDAPGTQRLPGNAGVTCPACPSSAQVNLLDFTRQSGNAPWSPRAHSNVELINRAITYTPVGGGATVTAPRNSLVLQGHTNGFENDVWLSTNHGANWALIAGHSVYGRTGDTYAAAPAHNQSFYPMTFATAFAYDSVGNYVYRVGGWNPDTNRCWSGVQYTQDAKRWVNINSGLTTARSINPAREYAQAITDSKGMLYVTGGRVCGTVNGLEDVWRSSDHGATWTRRTAQAPWGWRLTHLLLNVKAPRITGSPDVLIQMGGWTGGSDRNDVWASSDGGAKWELITLAAAWASRDDMNGEVTSAGLLIISGGKGEVQVGDQRVSEVYNDVWVSADGGYTWGVCVADAAFNDRRYQMTVLDEQGHLIVAGGENAAGAPLNDVWRSSLSFTANNAADVARACGITIPRCGIGLSCLPSSEGFRRLPGKLGVTCARCVNPVGYNRMDFVQVTPSASWSPRSRGNVELMRRAITWRSVVGGIARPAPANSLILQGNSNYRENDVWISTDRGVVWELIAGHSLYGRNGDVGAYDQFFRSSFSPDTYAPAFALDSNGYIYRIQGEVSDGGECSNDVWTTTNGLQWTNQYTPATTRRITPARLYAGAIGDSRGNIYVSGGRACTGANTASVERNDVWMSADKGKTWTQQTATAAFPRRAVHQMLSWNSKTLGKDTLIVFSGWSGTGDYNDVYASSDQGKQWRVLTAMAPWMSRDDANAEVTSAGLIVLTAGKSERQVNGQTVTEILNDVWVSPDGGYTWGSCLQDASYSDRRYQMTMMDELDFLYVMGGEEGNGRSLNDVWRSSISFSDLSAVQATCKVTIPPCGAGLNCWPNSPGFRASKRYVTCDACEAQVVCDGDNCSSSGGSSGTVVPPVSGLSTGAILAIIILVALGVVLLYFGYRYWQRTGSDANKAVQGTSSLPEGTTSLLSDAPKDTSDASTNGSAEGSYTAPASQATA